MNFRRYYTYFSPFLFLILLIGFSACSDDDRNRKADSIGKIGEITVVMDSTLWKGAVGDSIRAIFGADVPGLLNSEPDFVVRHIHPSRFVGLLQKQRNLVFVTLLDNESPAGKRMQQQFSSEVIARVNRDSSFFMLSRQNEYARGQEVLHLFGKDREQLLQNLSQHKNEVRRHFSAIERKRLQDRLAQGGNKELSAQLLQKYGFQLDVPAGFAIAKSDSNFVWLARPAKDITTYIMVAYKPYRSTEAFKPSNIIAWRDSIGYNHTYNRKIENSYVATQTYVLPSFTQTAFNGNYSIETRGLWKLANNSRGGPFISYTFVDESTNRLYYLEGFVLAPGVENKREIMREVESILWTFEPASAVLKETTSNN